MTPSPDLIDELQASRPVAPAALRARVRETARAPRAASPWERFRLPVRRVAVVAAPAVLALALVSAGAVGLSRSSERDVFSEAARPVEDTPQSVEKETLSATDLGAGATRDSAAGPTTGRAQRVSATLTVEVSDSDAVSDAAQDAIDLTRRLGGHVVSSSVTTGEQAAATMTVRVPVGKVQQAIAGLSGLGRIVSQQVTIDDLQASLDALERRQASLRNQVARIGARLDTESLEPEERAVLETRLQRLQLELRELRRGITATHAEARMSTIELTVATPEAGVVAPAPSRLERTLDEALDVLVWEGVIVLALAIVLAPIALLGLAAWLGQRLYRRREDERLLST
ncbi:MAG TPA: DUF4349 domain-containing protein [Gaiellaceae bacterium]|nr:DUF4349 domain-containing protein [Gaiellaceae bacterium]